MSNFSTIITKVGQAKLTAALTRGEALRLTHMAIGDGLGQRVTPRDTQTSLTNEVFRANLTSLDVDPANPMFVNAVLVIPAAVGGWVAREAGLYDVDGALIAVAALPESAKPHLTDGAVGELVVTICLQVGNAGLLELYIDPSQILATRQRAADKLAPERQRIAALEAALSAALARITALEQGA